MESLKKYCVCRNTCQLFPLLLPPPAQWENLGQSVGIRPGVLACGGTQCSPRVGVCVDTYLRTLEHLGSLGILDCPQEVQSRGYMQGLGLGPKPDAPGKYTMLWASASAEPWSLR